MKLSCSTLYISQPVAIRHGPLGFSKQHRQNIIDHFLKLKEDSGTTSKSWKTGHDIHHDHNILNPLLDLVHLWYCHNVVGVRGPKFITDQHWNETSFLDIDAEVWFQESLPGQGCPQHEHGTLSRYSWVYYLDVGEINSPLTFVEMQESKNEIFPVDEVNLPVYNDMVVMFPSTIHHKVYPVNETRYVLAGNINDIKYKDSE
tara:strand:- start:37 stop:642 length:606 start_codon:yes stop_codon:yes gene_type:complete